MATKRGSSSSFKLYDILRLRTNRAVCFGNICDTVGERRGLTCRRVGLVGDHQLRSIQWSQSSNFGSMKAWFPPCRKYWKWLSVQHITCRMSRNSNHTIRGKAVHPVSANDVGYISQCGHFPKVPKRLRLTSRMTIKSLSGVSVGRSSFEAENGTAVSYEGKV